MQPQMKLHKRLFLLCMMICSMTMGIRASQTVVDQLTELISSSSFNLELFIKAWADNFIFTIDQQYDMIIDQVSNYVAMTSTYPYANYNNLWTVKLVSEAQDKGLAFLSTGTPELTAPTSVTSTTSLSQTALKQQSLPLSSSAGYLSSLWLKGLIYPSVSPEKSPTSSYYGVSDPINNNICFIKFLKEQHALTDPFDTNFGPVITNTSLDCSSYGTGIKSDFYNRFSQMEIDTLLGGMSNGIYFDTLTASINPDTVKTVAKLPMSQSYFLPIIEVCMDILAKMTQNNEQDTSKSIADICTDAKSKSGPQKIEGPCAQCSQPSTFLALYNDVIGAIKSKASAINQSSDTEVNISFSTEANLINFDMDLPTYTEADLKDEPSDPYPDFNQMKDILDALKTKIKTSMSSILPAMQDQIKLNMTAPTDIIPFMSLDSFYSKDELFDVTSDELDCDGIDLDLSLSSAYFPSSNSINKATMFISSLTGDSAWSSDLSSAAAPINLQDSSSLTNLPQPWISSWESSNTSSTDTTAWKATPDSNSTSTNTTTDSTDTSGNSGLLSADTVKATRLTIKDELANEELTQQTARLIMDKALVSTSVYGQLVNRSMNLQSESSGKYCSPRMAKRQSSQWRLQPTKPGSYKKSWLDEMWTTDPTTILRHVAVLLAEINLRTYELTQTIQDIDTSSSVSRMGDIQETMYELSEKLSGISGKALNYDAGREVSMDRAGGGDPE